MANGLYVYYDVTQPTFYWADDNTQYGYNEHFASYGPTAGDIYGAQITLRSQPWWNVSIAGYTYGYGSWHNTSEATSMYTGVEFTNATSGYQSDSGASHTLYYYDNNGTKIQGWPNAGVLVNTSLATGFWYQNYWWWADRTWDQPWTC
jgi:hypothetical protein